MPLKYSFFSILNKLIISIISLLFLFSIIEVFFIILPNAYSNVVVFIGNCVGLLYITYCIIFFYYKSVVSSASIQPDLFDELFEKSLEIVGNSYCGFCEKPKNLRMHHCSKCNKCIGRFDHHSYFICNCVGDYTYRFYFNTLLYLFIYSLYIVFCISSLFIRRQIRLFSLYELISIMVLLGLSICSFLFSGLKLMFNIYLIHFNKTTHELFEKINTGVSQIDYDRGTYKNWREVLLYNTKVPMYYSVLPIDLKEEIKRNKND